VGAGCGAGGGYGGRGAAGGSGGGGEPSPSGIGGGGGAAAEAGEAPLARSGEGLQELSLPERLPGSSALPGLLQFGDALVMRAQLRFFLDGRPGRDVATLAFRCRVGALPSC
jgi:hypothetical protein